MAFSNCKQNKQSCETFLMLNDYNTKDNSILIKVRLFYWIVLEYVPPYGLFVYLIECCIVCPGTSILVSWHLTFPTSWLFKRHSRQNNLYPDFYACGWSLRLCQKTWGGDNHLQVNLAQRWSVEPCLSEHCHELQKRLWKVVQANKSMNLCRWLNSDSSPSRKSPPWQLQPTHKNVENPGGPKSTNSNM